MLRRSCELGQRRQKSSKHGRSSGISKVNFVGLSEGRDKGLAMREGAIMRSGRSGRIGEGHFCVTACVRRRGQRIPWLLGTPPRSTERYLSERIAPPRQRRRRSKIDTLSGLGTERMTLLGEAMLLPFTRKQDKGDDRNSRLRREVSRKGLGGDWVARGWKKTGPAFEGCFLPA